MSGSGWIVAGEDARATAAVVSALAADGHTTTLAHGPFGDEDRVAQTFETAALTMPRPAGVVALIAMPAERLLADLDLNAWDQTVALALRQAFLVAQRAVDDFMAAGIPGRLVFVLGWPGCDEGFTEVLESALHSFSRSIAKEYGRRGIGCNLVVASGDASRLESLPGMLRFLTSPDSSFVNGEVLRLA